MKVVGIDPGKSGGLSVCNDGVVTEVITMPTYEAPDGKDKIDFKAVANFITKHAPNVVFIENVHAMPGQGVTSMFNFGFSTGGLHGVCAALNVELKTVNPRTWQKTLMGDDKHEKEDTIKFCQGKWPQLTFLPTPRSKKPHDGMADSTAISYFGYLDQTNIINKI